MAAVDRSLVANLALFAGMAADELEGILQEARAVSHTRCSSVFEQGEEAHFFFVLLSGLVKATKATPSGQQVFMRYVRPGETFGVAVAIGLAQYPATAVALDDSSVLVWPSAAWPRLVAKYPALATNTLHTVGVRLQDLHTRVVEMSTQQVECRVARVLMRLMQQAGRDVPAGIEIDFPISRQDIAEMIGTTLHTVSRILSAWESQGLVGGGRQRVVIRDSRKLFALAEE